MCHIIKKKAHSMKLNTIDERWTMILHFRTCITHKMTFFVHSTGESSSNAEYKSQTTHRAMSMAAASEISFDVCVRSGAFHHSLTFVLCLCLVMLYGVWILLFFSQPIDNNVAWRPFSSFLVKDRREPLDVTCLNGECVIIAGFVFFLLLPAGCVE